MSGLLLTPEEAIEATDNQVIAPEVYDFWWRMTKQLLEAQVAKAKPIIEGEWRQKCEDLVAARHEISTKEEGERILKLLEKCYEVSGVNFLWNPQRVWKVIESLKKGE